MKDKKPKYVFVIGLCCPCNTEEAAAVPSSTAAVVKYSTSAHQSSKILFTTFSNDIQRELLGCNIL